MAIYRDARLTWGTQSSLDLHDVVWHRPTIMLEGIILWYGDWQKTDKKSEADIAEQAWTHMENKLTELFK